MENVAIYCDGAKVVVMLESLHVTPSMADEKVHPVAPPPVPGARVSVHTKGDRAPASGARPSENRGGDASPVSSTVCTPHGSGRLSSKPPPLPPNPDFEAWTAPPAPPTGDLRTTAEYPFEDSVDEGTPVPTTLPSASLDPASLASHGHAAIPVDVVAPLADPAVFPLPPLAMIETPMVPAVGDAAPISSKPPTSIAPNMPQIPKPVSSGARPPLAPGIVSTQAIPLTVPVRRSSKVYFVVAFAFAIVSGGIATAIGLLVTGRGTSEPVPTEVAPPTVSTAEIAAAPTSSSSVTAAPPAEPPHPADAPAASSVPTPATSTIAPRSSATAKSVANAVPTSRAKPKSDRIED